MTTASTPARPTAGPTCYAGSRPSSTARSGPNSAHDGGDVELVGIDDDRIVQIRLSGACQGCSSAAIHLAMQIEAAVKAEVPEVRFLEPVP